MQTRQLYGSLSASSAGVLFCDLPRGSRIHKVTWGISTSTALATGDYVRCEVSVNSSAATTTTDATGVISICDCGGFLTTSGASLSSLSFYDPVDISLGNVTRIYLNVTENGTAAWLIRALIHYS